MNDEFIEKYQVSAIRETTIFHLAINGGLSDYGLKNSSFTLSNVENLSNQTISTWLPPKQYRKFIGKILISKKENKLSGIIFFTGEDKIISKQFFSNYQDCNGLLFPCEILSIKYYDEIETYEKTTYKNIKVNDYEDNSNYYLDITEYK